MPVISCILPILLAVHPRHLLLFRLLTSLLLGTVLSYNLAPPELHPRDTQRKPKQLVGTNLVSSCRLFYIPLHIIDYHCSLPTTARS
jgi:hypothetical protein